MFAFVRRFAPLLNRHLERSIFGVKIKGQNDGRKRGVILSPIDHHPAPVAPSLQRPFENGSKRRQSSCVCGCLCTCVCVYLWVHTYMHAHTCVYTHIHKRRRLSSSGSYLLPDLSKIFSKTLTKTLDKMANLCYDTLVIRDGDDLDDHSCTSCVLEDGDLSYWGSRFPFFKKFVTNT